MSYEGGGGPDPNDDGPNDGEFNDFDPNEPMPQSSFFGGGDVDDDDDDDVLPGGLADALSAFDADADFDVLPPFANNSNKALDVQVKAKEKKIAQQSEELSENSERVGIMADHLKNVEQEHFHTQALVDSKTREIETEDHLKQLSEREAGRVTSDISKVDKLMLDYQDQLNNIQNSMFAANEKLEQFKLQMNWNQEELLQWSLAAKQKDEDRSALEKYEQLDSIKIKNLTLKMEKSARAVQEKKAELDQEVTESQAVQIELDKTSDEYRKLHVQRQDLVKQWNDAMEAMLKRDQAIAATGVQIADVKQHVRERERMLNEEKEFLSSEQANNKQLTVNMGTADRMSEKKREVLMTQKQEIMAFQDEVATQRNELEKAESECHATLTMNENLKVMKAEKIRRLEDFRSQLESTKHKLENEFATTDDLAERSKQVDSLHNQHEERLKQINKELQTLKETMFKHSDELFTLRKTEADLIAEISGAQGTSRNLQARIHELDQRSLKQQEMLYNIEFQVQQLERKVSHASGKRSLEETVKLNQDIVELQTMLEQTQAQHSMISNQVKRLHDDVRAAKRKYDDVCTERDKLTEKISEIELENDSSALEVRDSVKKKEETIVSHDVLKLEVKRLRDILTAKADDVLALENRKLQLELSMKEREKEVQLHQDVQKAEAKAAEEARHTLAMDLKERQIKVEKLKSKYETIAGRLQGPDDGEEHSQAYYIIAAAQQREELQREGDELNRNIRRSEKEIRMLTKTLEHLTSRNQAYRDSFHKANMHGAEAKLKGDLEEQHRSVSDNLYKQKSYLREITTDYSERKRILSQLVNNISVLNTEVLQKESEMEDIAVKVEQQDEQVDRANRQMLQKRDEFREVRGLQEGDDAVEDVHIALQERKRKNRVLLNLLRNFTEDNPGMLETVTDTLEGVGLKLGGRPSSSGSSRHPGSRHGRRPYSGESRPDSERRLRSGGGRDSARGNSRDGGVELPSVRGSRGSSRHGSRPGSRGRPDSRG